MYANKVRHLKTSDSRKWWDCVKQLSGNRKFSNMQIVKDGVSVGGADLACLLNDHFLSVSADLPSLDSCSLRAYLPAPEPVPTITPTLFIYLYTLFIQKFQFSIAGLNGDLYKMI